MSFQGKHNINRIDSFWDKVDKRSGDECWEWQAVKSSNGYGMFWIGDTFVGSHRFSWELHNHTKIPVGMHICHTCDNRKCVNPHHLFLGTPKENEEDKVRKGRQAKGIRNGQVGTKHWGCKLSESDVVTIRQLYSNGLYQSTIASRFGISQQQVSKIVRGNRWAWLV